MFQGSPQTWNTKYLQSPVLYDGRAVFVNNGQTISRVIPLPTDVRHFIQADDFFLRKIVKDEGIWDLPTAEDKVLACLKYVIDHVKYVSDKEDYGINEFWAFPNETLALSSGDCEDLSILVTSLARNAGVPAWRIKVCAGWVVVGPNAPLGGHAYTIFLREKDEEWVAMDACYYPNKQNVDDRLPIKLDSNYKDVWFTFNDQHSWANKPVTVVKSVVQAQTGI